MKTFTTLKNLWGSLTQNTSTDNLTLGGQLISDQHRYLLQKYFDNERTVTFSTIGSASLTTTGSLAIGATSATLSAAYTYRTNSQLVNFSSGEQRTVLFTYNSTAITWSVPLTATATTAISLVGVQDYDIPANISKIKNNTITIGQIKFQPTPVSSRQEWDMITTLPYSSDIPNYFFIYNGKLSIFPIPSTTGNVGTFNYKTRVADFSFADYSTGNIAAGGMVVGSTAVTGLNTAWITTGTLPAGVDLTSYNLGLRADPPYGDGIWYPILSVTDATHLTLALPVISAPNITASTTYTIGQLPLLSEDFHDMLVQGPLVKYFSTIVPDPRKVAEWKEIYNGNLELLKDYAGTKSVNVDLEAEPQQVNPNLFLYSNS